MATVLIVDDASFMRGSLKFIIEQAGHQVVGEASEGGEALALARRLKPEVMTLDVMMEGMDGISTLKAIQAEAPAVRVVMVSAMGQEDKQAEARSLGASGYIRKPFQRKDVVDELARVIGAGA
jgi:two-component system, chemotaxis family, chemotaxis protein CheY